MKPTAKRFIRCDVMRHPEAEYTIHVHGRVWSKNVGAVLIVGPHGQVVNVPAQFWDDGEFWGMHTWMEVMARIRRLERTSHSDR